jgi:hypothetical protein
MSKLSVIYSAILLSEAVIGCNRNPDIENNSLKLWYSQPALVWEEALPVGNGRLGAMVFGDPVNQRLQINEESIWAGSKINNNNPDALKNLPALQEAIFESRYKKASEIADENFLGTPPRIRSYQPLGDLLISYKCDWNCSHLIHSRWEKLFAGSIYFGT